MLETGAHYGFVLTAYAVTFIIFSSLTIAVAFDAKMQKQRMEKLMEAGIKRRSEEN